MSYLFEKIQKDFSKYKHNNDIIHENLCMFELFTRKSSYAKYCVTQEDPENGYLALVISMLKSDKDRKTKTIIVKIIFNLIDTEKDIHSLLLIVKSHL